MNKPLEIGWCGPTNECWEWILSHFQDSVVLRQQDIQPWIQRSLSNPESEGHGSQPVLMLASEFRSDDVVALAKSLEPSIATVPWCLLLGTDWAGHRRTSPLPEAWQIFYWYELYDRIMPWMMGLSEKGFVGSEQAETSASTTKRKISPRVQRWIDGSLASARRKKKLGSPGVNSATQMTLVVAETAETRQLWMESMARRKIACVATAPSQLDIWVQPDLIIIDIDESPLACDSASSTSALKAQLIERFCGQFPDSLQIVTDSFPRWQRWHDLNASGADVVIAKPFNLDGLLDTVSHCAS